MSMNSTDIHNYTQTHTHIKYPDTRANTDTHTCTDTQSWQAQCPHAVHQA